MSHNITQTDGVYSVRQPMWHGLGTVLEDYPTRDEAKALAHNWEPVPEPLYRKVPFVNEAGEPDTQFEEVAGWQANVRSDNDHLLGVTTDTYELVTNEQMYDIAEALESEAGGDVMYETGGSLKGGSKVWLLMRLKEPLVMDSKNPELTATIPYYSLQNSHDGSGAFRGQATMTRIVCDNTAQMADLDAKQRGTEFVFHHTKNVHDRIDEARAALAGWRESVETYNTMMSHLQTLTVSRPQVTDYVEAFIPMPAGQVISDRVRQNIEDARANWLTLWKDSRTMDGINGSAYGLVQCSVEYLNHVRRAESNETRFRRTFLNRDKLVTTATGLALSIAAG